MVAINSWRLLKIDRHLSPCADGPTTVASNLSLNVSRVLNTKESQDINIVFPGSAQMMSYCAIQHRPVQHSIWCDTKHNHATLGLKLSRKMQLSEKGSCIMPKDAQSVQHPKTHTYAQMNTYRYKDT